MSFRHGSCLAFVVTMLLCAPASAQLVELEPGPELRVRPWPRLLFERSPDFTPRIFVSQSLGEQLPVESPAVETPPIDQPPPHAHSGCNCPSCQGGATQEFPGYDKLPYKLYGECPPAVISEAWCRRPFYADVFAGAMWGDEFIDGQLGQDTSVLYGLRLGWDFGAALGAETRLAFSQVGIYHLADPSQQSQADLILWDVSLLYYFNSSLKLRPFVSIGLGLVDWEYPDVLGNSQDEKVVGVPISLGIKHRVDDWLAFRLDLSDNIAFGEGTEIGTQHNISITGAAEIRFGGPRTSYWAWSPRRHYTW